MIGQAPGPAPWYLEGELLKLASRHGALRWDQHGEGGRTGLFTAQGDVLLVVRPYTYVLPLEAPRILVWYQMDLTPDAVVKTGVIRFQAFDLVRLTRDTKLPDEVRRPDGSVDHVVARGLELGSVDIPTHLGEGRHDVQLPEFLKPLDELLLLFQGTEMTEMNRCIMEIRPRGGWLRIYPQDWFNQSDCDFGYQWPTRIARDPVTGRIFGEGIRLDGFVLDETNRQVERRIEI